MKEITHKDYLKFIGTHDHVIIENVKVQLPKKHEIKKLAPENFVLESV